jgi:hypothetical protein
MKDKDYLHNRLIKLADLMEANCDDPQFLKELNKEYKIIAKELFPKEKNKNGYTAKQIKESRKKALEQIKTYLDAEDIEGQFDDRKGDYYSNDKFIISYLCNHNGFPHEISIDKTDSFYTSFSGAKCIKARRSLVSEKQLNAFRSFERALVEEGFKLCATKEKKKQFFEKYAVAYNNRLKVAKK